MEDKQPMKKIVNSFRNNALTENEKVKNYVELNNILEFFYLRGDAQIEDEDTLQGLFYDCISVDISCSNNEELQNLALTALLLFCKCKRKKFVVEELPDVYIRLAFSNVIEDNARNLALEGVRCALPALIINKRWDPKKILLKADSEDTQRKILEELHTVLIQCPTGVRFFYEKLVPLMLDLEHVVLRGSVVEFALNSLPAFPVTSLPPYNLHKFQKRIKTSAASEIKQLQKLQDPSWHKIELFLIRCFGKLLFTDSDLTNTILEALESALRGKNDDDKLATYDCWIELIKQYGADVKQLCNYKIMKMVLTPLKRRVTLATVKQQFKVWVYLISIVKEKSSLCLETFMERYFRVPDVTISENVNSPPNLWQESTQVLLEMLGHYGHENDCITCAGDPAFKLNEPVITKNNFMDLNLKNVVIDSVRMCCIILFKWLNEPSREKVIRCLWGSLFNIIRQLDTAEQDIVIPHITMLLASCIEESETDSANYTECIVKPVFDVLYKDRLFGMDLWKISTLLVFPLIKRFIKYSDTVPYTTVNSVMNVLSLCGGTDKKYQWLNEIFEILQKLEDHDNIRIMVWGVCSKVLNEWLQALSTHTLTVNKRNFIVSFMVFPFSYCDIPIKEKSVIMEFVHVWGNTYEYILTSFTKQAIAIIKKLHAIVKENSTFIHIHAHNIALIYPEFLKILVKDAKYEFAWEVLYLASKMLAVTPTKEEIAELVWPTVLIIMNYAAQESHNFSIDSMCMYLCVCFQHMLNSYRKYTILDAINSFFGNLSNHAKNYIPQPLHMAVSALTMHEDDTVSVNAQKLFSILPTIETHVIDQQPQLNLTRGVKITNMARAITETLNVPKETSTGFCLLGQEIDKPTPVEIKGSFWNNNIKSNKRKANVAFPEEKEEEETCVVINESDPAKLTEQQVHIHKKLRCDIPALYQDLTQESTVNKVTTNVDNNVKENKKKDSVLTAKQNKSLLAYETTENVFEIEDATPSVIFIDSYANDSEENCNNNRTNKNSAEFVSSSTTCKRCNTKFSPNQNTSPTDLEANKINKLRSVTKVHICKIDIKTLPNTTCKQNSLQSEVLPNDQDVSTPSNKTDDNSCVPELMTGDDIFDDTPNTKIELKIPNPSEKQIEAMLGSDMSSGFIIDIIKHKEKGGKCKVDVSEDSITEQFARNRKIFKELFKIKMNIVGGDEVIQNLDLTQGRQTRQSRSLSGKKCSCGNSHSPGGSDCSRNSEATESCSVTPAVARKLVFQDHSYSEMERNVKRRKRKSLLEEESVEVGDENMNHSNRKFATCVNIDCEAKTDMSNKQIPEEKKSLVVKEVKDNLNSTTLVDLESQSSEDVIESSQESYTEIPLHSNLLHLTNFHKSSNSNTANSIKLPKSRQEFDSLEVENKINSTTFSPDDVMRLDLIDLNKSDENDICGMDTESLEMELNTSATPIGITTSPVGSDTPTRTSELLHNTIDISPIKIVPKSVTKKVNTETQDLFCSTPCSSKTDSHVSNDIPENDIVSVPGISHRNSSDYKANTRSAKLLGMVSDTPLRRNDIAKVEKMSEPNLKQKKSSRVMKMMESCEKQTDYQEDESEAEEFLIPYEVSYYVPEVIKRKDIFQFKTEPPNLTASPSNSILKGQTPQSKTKILETQKKRVSFSDPPTSCRKIYFRNEYEGIPMRVRSIKNSLKEDVIPLHCEESNSETETETLDVETQGSFDVTKPYLLDCQEPICPELIDCKEKVIIILKETASQMFLPTLVYQLHAKNVFTIGDLAKLTERDINRLPFKKPKVELVRKALNDFYKSNTCTEPVSVQGIQNKSDWINTTLTNCKGEMSTIVGEEPKIVDNMLTKREINTSPSKKKKEIKCRIISNAVTVSTQGKTNEFDELDNISNNSKKVTNEGVGKLIATNNKDKTKKLKSFKVGKKRKRIEEQTNELEKIDGRAEDSKKTINGNFKDDCIPINNKNKIVKIKFKKGNKGRPFKVSRKRDTEEKTNKVEEINIIENFSEKMVNQNSDDPMLNCNKRETGRDEVSGLSSKQSLMLPIPQKINILSNIVVISPPLKKVFTCRNGIPKTDSFEKPTNSNVESVPLNMNDSVVNTNVSQIKPQSSYVNDSHTEPRSSVTDLSESNTINDSHTKQVPSNSELLVITGDISNTNGALSNINLSSSIGNNNINDVPTSLCMNRLSSTSSKYTQTEPLSPSRSRSISPSGNKPTSSNNKYCNNEPTTSSKISCLVSTEIDTEFISSSELEYLNEQKQLREEIPNFDARFREIMEDIKKKNLNVKSFYKLILESAGAEEFISILLESKALGVKKMCHSEQTELITPALHSMLPLKQKELRRTTAENDLSNSQQSVESSSNTMTSEEKLEILESLWKTLPNEYRCQAISRLNLKIV